MKKILVLGFGVAMFLGLGFGGSVQTKAAQDGSGMQSLLNESQAEAADEQIEPVNACPPRCTYYKEIHQCICG